MKGYLLSVEFRFNSNCCECVTLGYSVTIGYDNDDNLEILSCLITQISVPPTHHQPGSQLTQSPSHGSAYFLPLRASLRLQRLQCQEFHIYCKLQGKVSIGEGTQVFFTFSPLP